MRRMNARPRQLGPGPDHRRCRRRPERHRDLFAGRRAIRLRDALVGAVHLPLMVGIQIVSARIGRVTGHGLAANIRDHFPRGAVRRCRPAARRQHHQHRRRPGRDGRGTAPARRRAGARICVAFRRVCPWGCRFSFRSRATRHLKWLTLTLFAYVGAVFACRCRGAQVAARLSFPQVALHARLR